MSQDIYLITLCLFLGAIVLIFGMRAAASMLASRAKIAGEAAYQQVAERAATAQAQTASALTEIKARLASVETILKAVE
jgi:hypothetical protein